MLSEIERAVITYQFVNGLKNWPDLYRLSHPTTKAVNLTALTSRWKNSAEVKNYLDELKTRIQVKIANEAKRLVKENEKGSGAPAAGTPAGGVNFTDINEFVAYLNQQANEINDTKDKQNYLKMLSDLLRFKDASTETDILRVYIPLSCYDCKLYKENNK